MYLFWDSIIKPLFVALQSREIVEIGADYGHNTRNILAYCQQKGGRAHIIDPLPKFDPDAFQEEFGDHFIFYPSLSLNALQMIDHMDAVLIDGDHNWYTVYHELRLIEKQCQQNESSFPLILVHDVGWPYARRDMYYHPENIPETYRMPYAKKGMDPDSAELIEKGGLNPHLCNAVLEHHPRNGVLTAIEDFVKESIHSLELVKIQGFHGLGILYPASFKESYPAFFDFIKELSASDVISQLLVSIEKFRIKHVITEEADRQRLRAFETARRRESEQADQEIRRLSSDCERLKEDLETMKGRLEAAERREAEKFRALEEKRQRESLAFQCELKQKQESMESLVRERDQLFQWVLQLQEQFKALIQSNRWRVGHCLVSLLTLSMFKKNFTMATDHIKRIFNKVDDFKS